MVVKQAIGVIGEALALGSKQGAYGIGDSALIQAAYESLTKFIDENLPKEESKEAPVEETTE